MSKNAKQDLLISENLDSTSLVQKPDPLLLMRAVPFTLGELKILNTYISRINAADDSQRTVTFTKAEYEELMGARNIDYRTLRGYTKGMLGKVVEIKLAGKNYDQFVLFNCAQYRSSEYGDGVIELTCSEQAKELFFLHGEISLREIRARKRDSPDQKSKLYALHAHRRERISRRVGG